MKKIGTKLVVIYLVTLIIISIIGYAAKIDVLMLYRSYANVRSMSFVPPIASLIPAFIYYVIVKDDTNR